MILRMELVYDGTVCLFESFCLLFNQRIKENRSRSTTLHGPSPRPITRPSAYTNRNTRTGGPKEKGCFKFRDNGHCRFGLNFRYRHEGVDHFYQSNGSDNNCFGSTEPDVRSNITSRNFSNVNTVNDSSDGFNDF